MKKRFTILLIFAIIAGCVSGCANQTQPDPKHPVTLTMWHVYGSQTTSPLNDAIDEFNKTVGKENGITVNVVSVTSSSAIDKALAASANEEPGAENMPDLFTAYPRTVEIVGIDQLLHWDEYFSTDELSPFKQDFLADGYFDNHLLMLPIAKSTEALFLNQTLFDRFCKETGITYSQLKTFEDLFQTASQYYDWSNGQNFLQLNDYYNYVYVGMKSYGSDFIRNGRLCVDDEAFVKVWTPLAKCAIRGGICLEDGYAAARWKTVEILANTGSTADVLYQPTEVIYSDNTSENITAIALPYPTFTDDFKGVIHRGGGLFAIKNEDERRNQAAYIFAKWITAKENNLNFVTKAGYLPVTDDAFALLFEDIHIVDNQNYHSVYQTIDAMMQDYTVLTLPLYNHASDIQSDFEQNAKAVLKSAHHQYVKRMQNEEDPSAVLNELIEHSLSELQRLTME